MLEKYLQDIGLNDKESSVYLALLGYENASVLELAQKTGIKRPTVYVVLESLAKKGLVSETTEGKKTHYYAEPPERLETFVERKILNLEESKKVLRDVVPQLKSISREQGEKPIVKYFEGKEGIHSAHLELLGLVEDSTEPIYTIYSRDLVDEIFTPADLDKFRTARDTKRVPVRSIYTSTLAEKTPDHETERILVDGSKYPIKGDITIYKDTVLITVLHKRISLVMVKNKDVAETMKSLFNIVFDSETRKGPALN